MRILRLGAGAVALAAAGFGWSLLEARWYTLRRFTVPVLPPGSAPLRVLHVSDIHLVPSQHAKRAWVASLADLQPDLVVSTGDTLADQHAVPAAVEAHLGLLERPGVFVLGSNDYYAPRRKNPLGYFKPQRGKKRIIGRRLPTRDLVGAFSSAGWLNLTNTRGTLEIAGQRLEFAGVDDPHLKRDRYPERQVRPSGPPPTLRIGVTHAPYLRVLDTMAADGADLILAGHTHGGQLCLPLAGALVTNCDLDRRRAKGLHRHQGAWMHVSAGLGTSPYTPVRFACRPEASLLTLVARADDGGEREPVGDTGFVSGRMLG